jgi:hypothetical protein
LPTVDGDLALVKKTVVDLGIWLSCGRSKGREWRAASRYGESRSIEHIGSAHDEAELAALTAAAERLAAGQAVLDLGVFYWT